MPIDLKPSSLQVLTAFALYLVGVLAIGIFSHRYLKKGSFVKEYFVGNRGLGPWVLALSVAATAVSGGSFMGFPSLIYTNGWVMALWISSYMIVPLTTMAFLGKRINQAARISGAVTVPDLLRDRFQSPALGLTATIIILSMMTVNLVAQYKGGGLVMKEALQLEPQLVTVPILNTSIDKGYLIGLIIFTATVIGYTTYGGFWAVTLTDVLEGLVMLTGVVILAVLAVNSVEPIDGKTGLAAATERSRQQDPALVYGPGPKDFLPLGLAFSFFLMWSMSGAGQPSGMVRLMSFKDSPSLRRALVLVAFYYVITYMSLVVVFVCARANFPTQYLHDIGTEGKPDSIMPVMVRHVAHPLVAGLLLAAPYAAIMSTVAAFLLMISSSLVRDIYQRCINPEVSQRSMKTASYVITALVGCIVMVGAFNPPEFLQYIIVFSTSALGVSFLMPMSLALYWRRMTKQGALAGMVTGFLSLLALYGLGWIDNFHQAALAEGKANYWTYWIVGILAWIPGWGEVRLTKFSPLNLAGFDPLVWGFAISLLFCVVVAFITKPNQELADKYFP